MMTLLRLNTIDERRSQTSKSMLGLESLRRLAWAIYFFDATISGGVVGQSTVTPASFTIQLPCDDRLFLQHVDAVTEPLLPLVGASHGVTSDNSYTLGIGAHLIRAMSARQIVAELHSRIQRRLIADSQMIGDVALAESKVNGIMATLPPHMAYSKAPYHIYKDQRPMLLALHVMQITVRRHLSLLKLSLPNADQAACRLGLVREAQNLSEAFRNAIEFEIPLDPQLAMHAYHGIESELIRPIDSPALVLVDSPVLVYQRSRSTASLFAVRFSHEEIQALLTPLIQVIRQLAWVSELVGLLVSPFWVSTKIANLKSVPRSSQQNHQNGLHRSFDGGRYCGCLEVSHPAPPELPSLPFVRASLT